MATVPVRYRAAVDADPGGGADILGPLHLHRFSADLRNHARRTVEFDTSDGDARLPARHSGWRPGAGGGNLDSDGSIPDRSNPVQLLWPAATSMAAGRGR